MSAYLNVAVEAGHINVAMGPGAQTETLALSSTSQMEQKAHRAILFRLECEKRGRGLAVPTTEEMVREELRRRGEPIMLFGENLGEVRDRLRFLLGKEALEREGVDGSGGKSTPFADAGGPNAVEKPKEKVELSYTAAPEQLVAFRKKTMELSSRLSRERLSSELGRRNKVTKEDNRRQIELDEHGAEIHKWATSGCVLESSVFGDGRPITSVTISPDNKTLATTGWSGIIKFWDISCTDATGEMKPFSSVKGHTDRVSDLKFGGGIDGMLVGSCGLDCSARIFGRPGASENSNGGDMEVDGEENDGNSTTSTTPFREVAVLKGHAKRCCKLDWSPLKSHIATTSSDTSWRLWDVETSEEILLQDGHFTDCYGIKFHKDGGLVSTSDFGGVICIWDVRCGKRITDFRGHTKRVLSLDWNANGFHLASGGDDGLIKVWDLRMKKVFKSIPGHSNVITGLSYDGSSEILSSCSFDGKIKLWSARDYAMLRVLEGHEGKVNDCCWKNCGVGDKDWMLATSGFDKTFKLWR